MEPWKYTLVAFLVCAISSKNLLARASQDGNTKMSYLFFSVSMFAEAFKLLISYCMYLHHYLRASPAETFKATVSPLGSASTSASKSAPDPDEIRPELRGWKENLLLCVPAIMFAITNNMHLLINDDEWGVHNAN